MKITAMPKFHPTAIIQDCWSSIGDIQLTVPGMGSDPSKMRSYMPASAGPVMSLQDIETIGKDYLTSAFPFHKNPYLWVIKSLSQYCRI